MGIVRGDNSLFFATALDNSGLQRGSLDAVNIIQGLGNKISKINPWAALAVAAVAAFTVIANEGYKMAKSFESAMAEVKTIANVSDKDFKKLEKNVFDIYKQLGTEPPDKLANGLYEIIGAGFEAGDALKILEISSKAATAGVTETAVASDGLTTILNAFKLTAEDAQAVADVMFATVDRGKISFEELSSQIAIVAPIAAASNISFQEIGAAISTLTKQGTPASVAMTQIRSAIISTNEVLGDGAFKTLSLQEGFQKMYESADGSQNKLKELAGRIEAVNGIIGIAGPNLKGATGDLDAMAKSAGSVDRSFKTITSTTANQWEIFGNKIKASTKGIGDTILAMSNGVARGLNKLIDGNESVVDSLREHRKKLNDLTFEYNDHNTSVERKREILEELKKINPAIVSGLGKEGDEYVLLNNQLSAYNELLTSRIGLEKELNKIKELNETKDALKNSVIDLETRAKDIIRSLSASFNNGQIDSSGFSDVLNTKFESNIQKLNELRKVINKESNRTNEIIFDSTTKGFAFSAAERDLERYKKRIKETSNEISEEQARINNKLVTAIEVDDDKKNQVLELLKAYKDIGKVSNQLGGNGFDVRLVDDAEIQKQIKLIDGVNNEIKKIKEITSVEYKKDKAILDEYLNSKNSRIKEAAEKQKDFFEFKIPTTGKDDRTDIERFEDLLNERKKEYESYNNFVNQLGKEAADKEFETLLKQGDNYTEYLRNQLKEFQDNEIKKKTIVDVASNSDVRLTPREKIEPINFIKPAPIVLDVKIDTTSINAINRRLNKLTRDAEKAQTDAERRLIAVKIDAEKEKLKAARRHIDGEEDLYENLTRTIESLSFKELRTRIANKKRELAEKLKDEKKYAQEIIKLQGEIAEAEQEIGNKTSDFISDITGVLGEASALFRKFGDEDTAQLLDQLAGVAEGAGKIAEGFASGNPLAILQGGLKVLNSALTVEIVSDTAKFEEAIKELEKAIDKLDYVISKSVGNDKITGRKQAIDDLKELEKQADLAKQAELEARKEVKFLGIRIGKKGKGSGTDPAKLEELEQKAEEARRKAQELREQLDELYTGTTQATIVDSIISGLKEGKRTVADFANNFKDLMQDAMLQAFQIKYLEKEIEKFYDAFADAGSDSNYTADEIDALRNLYNQMIQGAQDDLDAINQILEDSGIGSLGSEDNQQPGLAGAISNITEDQANIMAGTLNSMRIDIQNGLEAAQQSLVYLSQIAQNTSYNHHLEVMELRLTSIETLLS
ncbi:phage tail length tape-measure protein [Formosa sp. Hel1_33_131]|uniref:phage tail tape measure protein n=1 Tax=Formosa sp. Hel1_33_131 TaxID=1336794 RepID=UPI00084E127E|nr:phage tail tape measure protein [Formosa sp. Hel1_33_131]AOR28719.1 phage tail length tape-measure protein [Formosa sp. Hel1_33_131]